jgi:hypothetical protein
VTKRPRITAKRIARTWKSKMECVWAVEMRTKPAL